MVPVLLRPTSLPDWLTVVFTYIHWHSNWLTVVFTYIHQHRNWLTVVFTYIHWHSNCKEFERENLWLAYYSTSSVSTVTPTDQRSQLLHNSDIDTQYNQLQLSQTTLTRACPMAIYRSGQTFFIISHNKAQLTPITSSPTTAEHSDSQVQLKKKNPPATLCPYSTHTHTLLATNKLQFYVNTDSSSFREEGFLI